MPANLPPQYFEVEKRYRAAKNVSDKLAALEEMLRIMPKHKGTDHLQADLKAKIAKLKREPAKKVVRAGVSHMIPKEGAGQVVLVGPANTGKSSLLAALTAAKPEVADYPHTTLKPTPGMMNHEDVAIQLIDLPPLSEDYNEPWLFDLVRRADLVWLVLSVESPLSGLETTERVLADRKIGLYPAGMEPDEDMEPGWYYKEAVLVATGSDRPDAAENLEIFEELTEGRWPPLAVSTVTGQGLAELGRATFEALDIIRVYTKQPGKEPDLDQPFTLPAGSTVEDLAGKIHKDLQAKLSSARIWGSGAFDGQVVQRDHVLADKDVVEIRA